MKVMLLNPPFGRRFNRSGRWANSTRSNVICYPVWLAYATGWLEKQGVDVKLVDAPAKSLSFKDVERLIEDYSPDYLALDTATTSIWNDVHVANAYKKEFGMKVVLMGTHTSALPAETLELSRKEGIGADYVIAGEYDIALHRIVIGEEKEGIVQGIHFENLDELPFVSQIYKKHLNINNYEYSLARKPEVQIMGSRGCIHRCNYCVWAHVFTGRHVRWRSTKNVVDELEWIHNNLKVKDIVLEDDTFTDNRKRILEICREIRQRKLHVDWITTARANVPLEYLIEMKDAGCRLLIVGYESGVQHLLNRAKKGITLQQMLRFARDAKKARLEIVGCFMIGLLGETPETARATFEFAKKVDPDFCFFSPATPYAGTDFFKECKDRGYLISDDFRGWTDKDGYVQGIVNQPNFSGEDVIKFSDKFTWEYAFRPKFILKSLKKIVNHPIMETGRFARALMYGTQYYLEMRKNPSGNR